VKRNEEYLPVCLSLENKKFLVVGGGNVASRKIDLLAIRGANTTVVTRQASDRLRELEKNSLIFLKEKEYETSDLEYMDYVIAATDDSALNQKIYEECKVRNILINVVDDPEHCDFIFPSILRRGSITFTVSSGGKSPFLSAFLRQIMENAFGEEWAGISDMAAKFRKYIMNKYKGQNEKKNECYQRFLDVNWVEIMRKEGDEAMNIYYNQLLDSLEELE
jgi:siroheme synthase-like protein